MPVSRRPQCPNARPYRDCLLVLSVFIVAGGFLFLIRAVTSSQTQIPSASLDTQGPSERATPNPPAGDSITQPKVVAVTPAESAKSVNQVGSPQPAAPRVLPPQLAARAIPEMAFVGSSQSDKYHYPWCEWAKRINPSNRVRFRSAADAENQGYRPCKVCAPR